MPKCWRIVPEIRAASAFDGEGARRFGGRWNSPGSQAVYTAGSRALAVLEVLVHLNKPSSTLRFKIFEVSFSEEDVETVADPAVLRAACSNSISAETQAYGDEWLANGRSALLRVPSSIIHEEHNFVINPLHPTFNRLKLGPAVDFAFDARLLRAAS